jgi:hypothetical protein
MRNKEHARDTQELSAKKKLRREIYCKICGSEREVSGDVAKVTCDKCVSQLVAAPAVKTKPDETRPRGWHKKRRFVSSDGSVYEYGRLTDEKDIQPSEIDDSGE